MKKIICFLVSSLIIAVTCAQPVFNGDTTPTYQQTIDIYKDLSDRFVNANLHQKGPTDSGEPLHVFVITHPDSPGLQPYETKQFNKRVLLINNAIHPGEACGVNASIMMARYLLEEGKAEELLKTTVVCIIPMYNIGGALQRNSASRTNQNGPEEYGFRGNARNLDLNRDFVKMDSRNAQSFVRIFHEWDPHVFLETHTSNGADYQYTMTLLSSQKDKLDHEVSLVMTEKVLPGLFRRMEARSEDMVRYVNVFGRAPENGGIHGFLDPPRYSSGFATQFQCMSFISEPHMLKPFEDRVNATFKLIQSLIEEVEENGPELAQARYEARNAVVWQETFPLNWEKDSLTSDTLQFKGYRSGKRKSEATGNDRLYYDRSTPLTLDIPVFDQFRPIDGVFKPRYYVVPQAWQEVITRLHVNGVKMHSILRDTVLSSEVYYITHYGTSNSPYEGHYLHENTEVRTERRDVLLRAGDIIVPMYTAKDRFIVEVLEPTSVDSYFNWNFFDAILEQKEWFSAYVFEDEAAQMLNEDQDLRSVFEQMKADDSFAENAFTQLYWLYQQSEHYEEQHMRYPIIRIMEEHDLLTRPVRP